MKILHILNGDHALDGWRQNNFPGEVLVWRENYLCGMIPETDDMPLFNRIRAKELHQSAPDKSEDEIFAGLQEMHRKLFSLHAEDKVILWLDVCPFDQALKKQLLKLISGMPETPEVLLIQKDVVWNRETFAEYAP